MGVIKNGDGGGARDTTAVAMEACWKGQCCGQGQIVFFSAVYNVIVGAKRIASSSIV